MSLKKPFSLGNGRCCHGFWFWMEIALKRPLASHVWVFRDSFENDDLVVYPSISFLFLSHTTAVITHISSLCCSFSPVFLFSVIQTFFWHLTFKLTFFCYLYVSLFFILFCLWPFWCWWHLNSCFHCQVFFSQMQAYYTLWKAGFWKENQRENSPLYYPFEVQIASAVRTIHQGWCPSVLKWLCNWKYSDLIWNSKEKTSL